MLGHQFEGDEPSLRDIELRGSPYEPLQGAQMDSHDSTGRSRCSRPTIGS